ncbi:hypothetical protein [Nocardia brasiliensis]|uniref:hypothetical protein n=1 Tax=Nocardia brasiliensis TaxID=37326 RepID=UPI0024544229|nr:hypothetical protein [Nocardia brasiliensis]
MNEPIRRALLVLDVEGSSDLDNVELGLMRATLYRLLDASLPNLEAVAAKEDRGDGGMLVLDLPVLNVLDQIVEDLLDGVRKYNQTVDPSDWLRIRVAVHEGYVHEDEHGWHSDALTATFRMNGDELVKHALKNAARANGVVVISDAVYQSVVRHSYRPTVTPAGYGSAVISPREGDVRIWVRIPGYPTPQFSDRAVTAERAGCGISTGADRPDSNNANNLIIGNVKARMIVGRDNHGGTA